MSWLLSRQVEYQCEGFLEKNRDTVYEEQINILKASQVRTRTREPENQEQRIRTAKPVSCVLLVPLDPQFHRWRNSSVPDIHTGWVQPAVALILDLSATSTAHLIYILCCSVSYLKVNRDYYVIIPLRSDCEEIKTMVVCFLPVSAGCRSVSWEGRCGLLEVVQSERPSSKVDSQSSQQRSQEDCRTSGELSAALCMTQ